MENATSNFNGKIRICWSSAIDCNILDEDEHQITCEMKHNGLNCPFITTLVYAKCKEHLRKPLWDMILQKSTVDTKPWCFVGDFNVINNVEEKLGGLPYDMRKNIDFIVRH